MYHVIMSHNGDLLWEHVSQSVTNYEDVQDEDIPIVRNDVEYTLVEAHIEEDLLNEVDNEHEEDEDDEEIEKSEDDILDTEDEPILHDLYNSFEDIY